MNKNYFLSALAPLLVLCTLLCWTANCSAKDSQTVIKPQMQADKEAPLVVIYTLSTCPHCAEAKEYMKKRGIAFANREVDNDDEHMAELMKIYDEMKVPEAKRGVPLLVIGGKIRQQGFNQEKFEKAVLEVAGK